MKTKRFLLNKMGGSGREGRSWEEDQNVGARLVQARWDDAAKTHFALICVSAGHTTPPRPAPQATFAIRIVEKKWQLAIPIFSAPLKTQNVENVDKAL